MIGVGALLAAAFLTANVSRRFGVPSLLLYLGLGLFFGNGGVDDFLFDQPAEVERCAELALGLLLFKGGYEFRHGLLKRPAVLMEGLTLALPGTLLTAVCTAVLVHFFLQWNWLEALLLGAVLSSTDAAAVFSLLSSSGLRLKKDTGEVLELESSTNDPLAYGLVAGLVVALQGDGLQPLHLFLTVSEGLLFGLLMGALIGFLMVGIARFAPGDEGSEELLWLAVLTSALGVSELGGANPLITAFIAGVVLSSRKRVQGHFWGQLVALAEVVLFLLLGLQSFPSTLWTNLNQGVVITVILVLVSRPVAVFLLSNLFQRDWRRSALISWAGLRGASPIVFGLLPLIAGVSKAEEIFSIVFVVVLLSVLIQGTTLNKMAQLLNMKANP